MMKNIIIGTSIGLLALVVGCEEKDSGPADKVLPTINKISPAYAHQSYDFGDTAFFTLEFSDNDKLKEVSLRIYVEPDSVVMFTQKFPNASTANIDTFVIMNDPLFSELNFDISATDPSGNLSRQSSHIHLR